MGKLQQVNTDKFNELINSSDELIVADFYADWCGPCKMLAPILESVAEEMENVQVLKINVDQERDLSAKMGIRSIPTILLFKGGEQVDKFMGAQPKNKVVEIINKNLETTEIDTDESED